MTMISDEKQAAPPTEPRATNPLATPIALIHLALVTLWLLCVAADPAGFIAWWSSVAG